MQKISRHVIAITIIGLLEFGPQAQAETCAPQPASLLPAWAANYSPNLEIYVAPNGDDSNDGSRPTSALKTADAALRRIAAGVRLNFAAGTYACPTSWISGVMGDISAPASIRAIDGPRTAKFDCGGSAKEFILNNVRGFIFEGVEISNTSLYGIQVMSGSGPWTPGEISGNIVVRDSYIHNTGLANMKSSQAEHFWIINNELAYANTGRQNLEFVAVDDVVIAGNEAHNSGMFDEIKGGAQGGTIYRNFIHDSLGGIIVGGDNTGTVYLVHKNANYEAENLAVWDNVIANPSSTDVNNEAFRVIGCHNCEIDHNSFWATNPAAMMRIGPDVFSNPDGSSITINNMNLTIQNNLFGASGRPQYWISNNDGHQTSGLVMSYNAWRAVGDSTATTDIRSAINILGDPNSIYNRPAIPQDAPYNLRLQSSSPLNHAGLSTSLATNNADGLCWSGAPDIGAY